MPKIFTYLPMVAVLLTYNCAAEQAPQAGPPTMKCPFSPKGISVLNSMADLLTRYSSNIEKREKDPYREENVAIAEDLAKMSKGLVAMQSSTKICEKK